MFRGWSDCGIRSSYSGHRYPELGNFPLQEPDLPQIHYLRTLADVNAIKNTLKPNARLLIVGAGYIGLEVAASAVVQGVEVTVIEAMDRVLARVTGLKFQISMNQCTVKKGWIFA